jgi:VCBS repeat-containing protein
MPESPVPTVDTNTTYTFIDGTESFTVTPSDGDTQKVNVTLTQLHDKEGGTNL